MGKKYFHIPQKVSLNSNQDTPLGWEFQKSINTFKSQIYYESQDCSL